MAFSEAPLNEEKTFQVHFAAIILFVSLWEFHISFYDILPFLRTV